MKIARNNDCGGWELSENFLEKYPQFEEEDIVRDDIEFIKCLEEFGIKEASTEYSQIEIVEIPDQTTDYIINEYEDWYKSIIYVVNEKIFEIQ